MLYAGPICCGGFVPMALIFAFLVLTHFLTQKITRKESLMEQKHKSNIINAYKFRFMIFLNSLFTTIWAIGASVAAAGVHKNLCLTSRQPQCGVCR
jgi:hypothetical protein